MVTTGDSVWIFYFVVRFYPTSADILLWLWDTLLALITDFDWASILIFSFLFVCLFLSLFLCGDVHVQCRYATLDRRYSATSDNCFDPWELLSIGLENPSKKIMCWSYRENHALISGKFCRSDLKILQRKSCVVWRQKFSENLQHYCWLDMVNPAQFFFFSDYSWLLSEVIWRMNWW